MRKLDRFALVLLLFLAWSFVFSGQKTFARDADVVLPPAPTYTAARQRAVTANGDTVAIREIVKEKDPCEKCECACKYDIWIYGIGAVIICLVCFFIFLVWLSNRMSPR